QAVVSENQNTSGGAIILGDGRYQLKVPGEFETPEEILSLVVAAHNGNPIYLKDVATVVDGIKEETSRSRLDGVDSVNISVKKRVGENIIFISDKIDTIVMEAEKTFPKNTIITKLMDQSNDIRLMIADLENNILSGLVLVVIILFIVLGFRNALLVGLAIPFSMFLSFTILHAMGYTLNMIVLFSLTLALGMLVDNAIVIIENIYRYMQQGIPRVEAAMKATGEVAWPVIGSTLTTIAAFFPMIFWPGMMGEFMKYLPMTVIITLLASLLVAIVFNPVLCARFMRVPQAKEGGKQRLGDRLIGFGLRTYEPILVWALRHRALVTGGMIAVFIAVFALFSVFNAGVELFPDTDPTIAYVNVEAPSGTRIEMSDTYARQVEQEVSKAVGLKAFTSQVGAGGGSSTPTEAPSHLSQVTLEFLKKEYRPRSSRLELEDLRGRLEHFTGARLTVQKQEEGPPTGKPINIEISGDDFETLGVLADRVKQRISGIEGLVDILD
ncbi:MAG: efflux RND transporter permease subunit, partial [Desulfobacula sp.]|nr:efflux RND transporter permease subunit [Desulfobacula sp.]